MTFPPVGSCDCHMHVIGPKSRFPISKRRSYTPVDAPISLLEDTLQRCGVDRVVLIQTSIFGNDNSCMLDGLKHLGTGRARAVAVMPDDLTQSEADRWFAAGVRGIRLNFSSVGTATTDDIRKGIKAILPNCERFGWHIQFLLPPEAYLPLVDDLLALPVDTVLDHFAYIKPGVTDPAVEKAVIRLLERGKSWVKLSGTYRLADDRTDPAIGDLARRLHSANPDRTVWASDWPHTPVHTTSNVASDGEMPYRDIDTPDLIRDIERWFDDPADHQRILVDNPGTLYDFD